MYLQIDLPQDELLTSKWTNRVGFRLLKKVEFYVGNLLLDRQYGLWMHIWSELTHTQDKKNLLGELIGPKGNDGLSNGFDVNTKRTLNIPLMFFFCNNYSSALPLFAIKNKDVYLKFYFEKKSNCIQSGTVPAGDLSNAKLWVDYIFLDRDESLKIIQNEQEYVFETVLNYERNLVATGTKNINLSFNLPTKELFWTNRPLNNNLDKFTNFTINGENSIKSIQFKLNGKNIFSSKPRKSKYFNYIIPYKYHTGKPDLGINCYSFCLEPENYKTTGNLNLRNIDKFSMVINSTSESFLNIFARSYNIIKIKDREIDIVYKF